MMNIRATKRLLTRLKQAPAEPPDPSTTLLGDWYATVLTWSANHVALFNIARVRMSYDPTTRAYRDAHLTKGWTVKAILRALKHAIAREVFHALAGHCTVPDYSDLRPARRAKNLTLTAAAKHLGVWPARIGELELGRRPNHDLANCYRAWLTAA